MKVLSGYDLGQLNVTLPKKEYRILALHNIYPAQCNKINIFDQ